MMTEDEVWEPLSTPDFWVLGFVATFQTVALLVCAHLLRWRKWPPYVTKNVDVVIISVSTAGVGGGGRTLPRAWPSKLGVVRRFSSVRL